MGKKRGRPANSGKVLQRDHTIHRKSRFPVLLVSILAGGATLALIFAAMFNFSGAPSSVLQPTAVVAPSGQVEGSTAAPVTVTEWGDYQ